MSSSGGGDEVGGDLADQQLQFEEIKNSDDEQDLSAMESREEAESKGLACKEEGNAALIIGHYNEAVHHYSSALSHLPGNAILLSNRALAYINWRTTVWPSRTPRTPLTTTRPTPRDTTGEDRRNSHSVGRRRHGRTFDLFVNSGPRIRMRGPSLVSVIKRSRRLHSQRRY
jgi:hypothetical protein